MTYNVLHPDYQNDYKQHKGHTLLECQLFLYLGNWTDQVAYMAKRVNQHTSPVANIFH